MSPLQQGQSDGIANTVTSQKNSVRLDGLKANARYMVQVRARTVAGYGRYSLPTEFQTTAEGGRYQHWAASITQPSHACPFPSLTLIPACHSIRFHQQDFPGAASDRGFGHCRAGVRHRGGGDCYRLLQVLAFQGRGFQSWVWGLLMSATELSPSPVGRALQLQSQSEGLDWPHVGPRAGVLWEDCASASRARAGLCPGSCHALSTTRPSPPIAPRVEGWLCTQAIPVCCQREGSLA